MKKLSILALILMLLLTGCQPTPETPVVVGKNNTPVSQESVKPFTTPPAHWKEDEPIMAGEVTLTIDADISMPDVTKYPVIEVGDHIFTQEEATQIMNVLSKGNKWYPIGKPTRAELEEDLIILKGRLAQRKKDGMQPEIIAHTEALIANVEAQLKIAPENEPVVPVPTGFSENEYGREEFRIRVDFGRDDKALIGIYNGSEALQEYDMAWQSSWVGLSYPYQSYGQHNTQKNEVLAEGTVPLGIKTTREEAIAQAEALLEELGITDMRLEQMRPAFLWTGTTVDENTQCWQLAYVSAVEGIPIMYRKHLSIANTVASDIASDDPAETSYNANYYLPTAIFHIDDEGIVSFEWTGPFDILKTINENAALLAFEDIQARILQQLPLNCISWAESSGVSMVHVTSVELVYMRVRIKDTQNGYMLLPVWDVYGYRDLEVEDLYGNVIPRTNPQNNTETLLTLSALDGSHIDRRWGY